MSAPLIQSISVPFRYPVYFTRGVFNADNPDLATAIASREPGRRHRVMAVVDRGVAQAWPVLGAAIRAYAKHHGDQMQLACDALVVGSDGPGEDDLTATAAVLSALDKHDMDRGAVVLIVGGGSLLDNAGYAADATHRALRVVRVPTTTLAQADHGVGVKNAANAFGKRDPAGTFAPPFAVLVDSRFLWTQSLRDLIAGMAEAVKIGLVRDAAFFGWLSRQARDIADGAQGAIERAVSRSAQLHLEESAAASDFFETRGPRPLEFGHWAAHRLEGLTQGRLRHGEAVAIGMALDTFYAIETGLCDTGVATELLATLRALGFLPWDEALNRSGEDGRPLLLGGTSDLREQPGGPPAITLPVAAGKVICVREVDERAMERALDHLRSAAA